MKIGESPSARPAPNRARSGRAETFGRMRSGVVIGPGVGANGAARQSAPGSPAMRGNGARKEPLRLSLYGNALLVEHRFELARLEHLHHDVAAADELAL